MNSRLFSVALRKVPITLLVVFSAIPGSIRSAPRIGELPKISANTEYKFNSLFFTFDFLSQSNTLGVVNEGINQPSYSSGILFYSKHNFDLGVSAIVTDNSDTSFTKASTEFDFMGGYAFSLSDDLTLYPSYTHFEYSSNSYTLQSVFSDIVQTDLYLDKKHYYGGITVSYLFGRKNTFYASIQNAMGFNKEDFLIKNSYLSMHLEIDVSFSDKNFYNEYIYFEWTGEEFLYWISDNYPRYTPIIFNQIRENGLEDTKMRFYELLEDYDSEMFKPKYTLTSIDIMLPIYYSIGSFMFNFTSYILIPTFSSTFYDQNPLFIFNAGLAYTLNFD